ncbi:hypothetical protein Bhyg_13580 [Pseudolycoriella hygida]|uniref:Uncharacterized protein n=1 Tax=Pseudolycoriella hygida TaxID=35572 RepID=A0A9Q0MN42_9DIPT|nr:hypothetical protein Bhyg_13580 [Pseudolycoriella hygida]
MKWHIEAQTQNSPPFKNQSKAIEMTTHSLPYAYFSTPNSLAASSGDDRKTRFKILGSLMPSRFPINSDVSSPSPRAKSLRLNSFCNFHDNSLGIKSGIFNNLDNGFVTTILVDSSSDKSEALFPLPTGFVLVCFFWWRSMECFKVNLRIQMLHWNGLQIKNFL